MTSIISTFHDLKSGHQLIGSVQESRLSPLMLAAKHGDCEKMSALLKQASDLNHPSIQDAFCLAAMKGHEKIIELMIKSGVNPNPVKSFDIFQDAFVERLTAMGHAVENRRGSVIEVLLKYGIKIEDVSREEKGSVNALSLFFSQHPLKGNNPDILRLLISKKADIHSLRHDTVFKIAVYANIDELDLLIEAGLDPKLIYRDKSDSDSKGEDALSINLLDLTVMRAGRANIFKEDIDSIRKVALLLKRGAKPSSCKGYCSQVSLPSLIKLFGESGLDLKAKTPFERIWKQGVSPIESAHTSEAVELLCSFGEDKEKSPFLKGTKAHKDALIRVGFNPEKGLNQLDDEGELLFIKAFTQRYIAAFVALIGEGLAVNQKKETGASYTTLHKLFSNINDGSINEEYDYISIAENIEIRFINILIKHGAAPLKDAFGRTPLMCLTFKPFNTVYNHEIIDMYINFEAAYFKLDPEEYREKFFKLRDGGFSTEVSFSAGVVSVPIKSVFDKFWASFETHSEFNPRRSHSPTEDWNSIRSSLEGTVEKPRFWFLPGFFKV